MHSVPSGLNLMARLCLISTAKDFSLDTTREYAHLTHPKSFSACLNQVCHSTYKAFLKGDSAMKDIVSGTTMVSWFLCKGVNCLHTWARGGGTGGGCP